MPNAVHALAGIERPPISVCHCVMASDELLQDHATSTNIKITIIRGCH